MELHNCNTVAEIMRYYQEHTDLLVPLNGLRRAYELGQQSNTLPVIDMAAIKEATYTNHDWTAIDGMPDYLRNVHGQVRKERRSKARGLIEAALNGVDFSDRDVCEEAARRMGDYVTRSNVVAATKEELKELFD